MNRAIVSAVLVKERRDENFCLMPNDTSFQLTLRLRTSCRGKYQLRGAGWQHTGTRTYCYSAEAVALPTCAAVVLARQFAGRRSGTVQQEERQKLTIGIE